MHAKSVNVARILFRVVKYNSQHEVLDNTFDVSCFSQDPLALGPVDDEQPMDLALLEGIALELLELSRLLSAELWSTRGALNEASSSHALLFFLPKEPAVGSFDNNLLRKIRPFLGTDFFRIYL